MGPRDSVIDLFRTLRELFGGATIIEILSFLKALVGIGPPPDVEDESALRKWVSDLIEVVAEYARTTENELDDTIADFLQRMIGNNNAWAIAYAVLKLLLAGETVDDEYANRLSFEIGAGAKELEAIDPLTIVAIIKMIVDIIKLFRREDQ